MFNRRTLLGAGVLSGVAAAARGQTQGQSAPPAKPPARPTTLQRLTAAATANRHALAYDGRRFSGPGWDWLVAEGRQAQHFLFGEDHGYAEIADLSAALAGPLGAAGYQKAAVEISPTMAAGLDAALAGGGGAVALKTYFEHNDTAAAFYTLRQEAEALAAMRHALPPRGQVIFGLDYEVFADRLLIGKLKARRKPAAAQAALAVLEQASTASWAEFGRTRNPALIYSFAGDPQLVRALRAAWPSADAGALEILETLEETFEINRFWVSGQGYNSNLRRSNYMRRNLARAWRDARARGDTPRTYFKFGASHVMRGLNTTDVYDIGTLASEAATLEGRSSFHLMATGGAGAVHAVFNPVEMKYVASPVDPSAAYYLPELSALALETGYTVFDLRPLRPILSGSRVADVSTALSRVVHGFDALAVFPRATASVAL